MDNYDDRNGTYTLDISGLAWQGAEFGDWIDSVVTAAAAIRADDREFLTDPARIREALEASRCAAEVLAAVDDELLLAGRKVLSLRELGKSLKRHHASVAERLGKLDAGKRALRKGWLLRWDLKQAADAPVDEPTRRGDW